MLAAAVCYPVYAKASAYIGRRRRVACVFERFKFRIALVLRVVFPLADVVSDGSVVRTMPGIGMIVFAGLTIFFMVVPATVCWATMYAMGKAEAREIGSYIPQVHPVPAARPSWRTERHSSDPFRASVPEPTPESAANTPLQTHAAMVAPDVPASAPPPSPPPVGPETHIHVPVVIGLITAAKAMENVPKTGTLQISYTCAPEDRSSAARQKLLATYGPWQRPVREEDIIWWAALTEAPKDVIHFLEFLIARFKNVHDAFVAFDGVDGNGQISLREFEAGIRKLRCHKFRGADEKQRIVNIFRYLDAGEEGEVSRREWGFLESLWRELRQSIREFVGFLERTFDGRGNDFLDEAWRYLDDDKSGALELEEWEAIVQGKLSYFGPCMMVFHFLDVDDGGTVSLDEFRTLEEFKDAG